MNTRKALCGAVAGFALLWGLGTLPADAAGIHPTTALPAVDVAAVEAAAQDEGLYGNKPGIGDDPSTRLIQQALSDRGFATPVDGWYGRATTAAYAEYQRSLGFQGIDANGLPGPTSLANLGAGRFGTTHPVTIGSNNERYDGFRVNARTKAMLLAADALFASGRVTVQQGSYCAFQPEGCVASSAGTHDGGGVVDVSVAGLTTTQRWSLVQALRTVGFAAWLRTPAQGPWGYHVHAVAIGDSDLWQRDGGYTNRDQVADYYTGRNGLASHAADNTPAKYRVAFTWWEAYESR